MFSLVPEAFVAAKQYVVCHPIQDLKEKYCMTTSDL
jgi:hypothetical protein